MKVYYVLRSAPLTRICEYVPNGNISHLVNNPNIIIYRIQEVR